MAKRKAKAAESEGEGRTYTRSPRVQAAMLLAKGDAEREKLQAFVDKWGGRVQSAEERLEAIDGELAEAKKTLGVK